MGKGGGLVWEGVGVVEGRGCPKMQEETGELCRAAALGSGLGVHGFLPARLGKAQPSALPHSSRLQ